MADWPILSRLDNSGHDAVMAFGRANPLWVNAMQLVTQLGATLTLVFVDAALVGLCLARRRGKAAVQVTAVALLAWTVRISVRELVARPRPADGFWTETQAAFPSGHATNTTVTVG